MPAKPVRRPAGFFQHLLSARPNRRPRCPRRHGPLASHVELLRTIEGSQPPGTGSVGRGRGTTSRPKCLLHSAALSQRRYLDDDFHDGDALFPADRYDEDRQQVDLRQVNSLAAAAA